jgi:hypothetical protein
MTTATATQATCLLRADSIAKTFRGVAVVMTSPAQAQLAKHLYICGIANYQTLLAWSSA